MAKMGKYCKAYLLGELRAFPGWRERSENAQSEKKEGQEVEIKRELSDDSIVYLQETYVVTDGIFQDEHILFDNVTPEWIAYCQQTMQFEIPQYEPIEP